MTQLIQPINTCIKIFYLNLLKLLTGIITYLRGENKKAKTLFANLLAKIMTQNKSVFQSQSQSNVNTNINANRSISNHVHNYHCDAIQNKSSVSKNKNIKDS